MNIEILESRNLVRFTFPDGREIIVQAVVGGIYGDHLEVRADSSIQLLPIVGSNGIAIKQ